MSEIDKDLQNKIAALKKFDDYYYNKNESLISDQAYDLLKDMVLKSVPPNHPLFKKVGHKVASPWVKKAHKMPMGSQSKVSDTDSIEKWVKNIQSIYGLDTEFVIQHKIDGFSLEMVYNDFNLVQAVTRGDGHVGEDITDNAKYFRYLPTKIGTSKGVVVRGEAVLYPQDFEEIQKKEGNRYKNTRNAASGLGRRRDGRNAEYIRVIAFDIDIDVSTETEKIERLHKLGFRPVKTYVCTSLDDILRVYKEYKETKRGELPYGIDGLVLRINDIQKQEELGVTNNRPNGQVALKFDSDQAMTTLTGISNNVGRTGKITPVGFVEPVDLMGSTITKLTLHNYSQIESLMLTEGAEVVIEKKGDIIPQIVEVVLPGKKEVNRPEKCPSCGGRLEDDGINIWCHNDGCKDREASRISYWLESIKVVGFSRKFIDKMWDKGLIRKVSDLYKLKPKDFIGIEGIGDKTVKSFFEALGKTSTMTIESFIKALGVPGISDSTASLLAETFKDWDSLLAAPAERLSALYGIGDISANNIAEGLRDVADVASNLLSVISIEEVETGTALEGKSFCVSGSLESMGRTEFFNKVKELGGTPKKSVVKTLDYLVTNDKETMTGKVEKASKLGISIISEKEFLDMCEN